MQILSLLISSPFSSGLVGYWETRETHGMEGREKLIYCIIAGEQWVGRVIRNNSFHSVTLCKKVRTGTRNFNENGILILLISPHAGCCKDYHYRGTSHWIHQRSLGQWWRRKRQRSRRSRSSFSPFDPWILTTAGFFYSFTRMRNEWYVSHKWGEMIKAQ